MKAILMGCEQCAHCVELYTPNEKDSDELKEARLEIECNFARWIGEHYAQLRL